MPSNFGRRSRNFIFCAPTAEAEVKKLGKIKELHGQQSAFVSALTFFHLQESVRAINKWESESESESGTYPAHPLPRPHRHYCISDLCSAISATMALKFSYEHDALLCEREGSTTFDWEYRYQTKKRKRKRRKH